MTFFIFMSILALTLIFALWLIFRSVKPRPRKKIKQTTKKLPANSPAKPDPNQRRKVFKRQVATELLKRNPEIVSAVIRQWLREK